MRLVVVAEEESENCDLDNENIVLSIAGNMEGKTICVFADAAAWPVQSYIAKFRSEFEYHIANGKCDIAHAYAHN